MTKCKCELAGWCETHKRKMSQTRFDECKNKPGYFEVFQQDLARRQEAENNKGLGLGDVVEKVAEVTGIKKVVEAVFGKDCGCQERKEALNKIRLK